MRPRNSRYLSLPAPRFFLLICGLALILSALLLACGGEESVEQNGSGQGTRPAEATAEARAEEDDPTATRSAPTGAAASTTQSGSASTAGGRAEAGTPTATRAASTGAVVPTPEAAGRSASSTQTASTEASDRAKGSELEEYAAEHAGGPGAIYVGDISQLVGPPPTDNIKDFFRHTFTTPTPPPSPAAPRPTPTPFGRAPAQSTPTPIPTPTPTPSPTDEVLLDPDGNVTLKALEQHLWIYESPFYAELIEKAKLTNPTPLTSSGEKITINHACARAGIFDRSHDSYSPGAVGYMPCTLLRDYFAPNLRDRTNGQVEFIVSSFIDLGWSWVDVLGLVTNGTVDSATFFGSSVGGVMEIQNLWGIYSTSEQEFEANQAIIKDIEELVLSGTGGVIMNHSWYSGNDWFIFCRERIDTPDRFAGKEISFLSSAGRDWIDGMGATHQFVSESGRAIEAMLNRGSIDCAVVGAGVNYQAGSYWRSMSGAFEYMIGPLPNFSFHNNVINREVWNGIPADLQQIILEEAAKSELEALRLTAAHNEVGLIKTIDAAMRRDYSIEFIPFSEEMKRRSFDVAMNSVIPGWVDRLGGASYPIIADTFNNKLGPIVGLRINPDGRVVKTN